MPIADTAVGATLILVAGTSFRRTEDPRGGEESRDTRTGLGALALAVTYGASAINGYVSAARCRDIRAEFEAFEEVLEEGDPPPPSALAPSRLAAPSVVRDAEGAEFEGIGEDTPGEKGEICTKDRDCDQGLVCDSETKACRAADEDTAAPGAEDGRCTSDGECEDGLVCDVEADVCTRPDDGSREGSEIRRDR